MHNKTKSVVFILLSSLSFAIMSLFVKSLSGIPVIEKVFFRNLVSLFVTIFLFRNRAGTFWGEPANRRLLLLRSILGLSGVFFYFTAISNLNLADAATLNKLSPFFVTIFAFFFLGEKIYKPQIIALIVVFSAAMLIIKPRFDLSVLPSLAGLMSAICAGAAYAVVRALGIRGEQPKTIVFYFSFVSVVVMLPLVFLDFVIPTSKEIFYLIGIGIFAAGGQFGLTYAYRLAKASEVSIYSYSYIVFAAMLGFFIWKETPDILSLTGAILIVLASYYIFRFNQRRDNQ